MKYSSRDRCEHEEHSALCQQCEDPDDTYGEQAERFGPWDDEESEDDTLLRDVKTGEVTPVTVEDACRAWDVR